MAIRLITGVPGSGKTYYAVYHLLNNYCRYNKELQEYQLKEDHTIITNIDCLTLPHINLDDALKKSNKTVHEFFQVPYQEKITEKYKKIIYLLDESQRFFPYRNKIGSETFFYFEYHRHLGHDVYIITQDKKLVAQNIILLAENELRACKRTFSIFGEFRYLLKTDNEIIDRITIRSQKKIFQVYKSFDSATSEKVSNPFKKYILALVVASMLLSYVFKEIFFSSGSFVPLPSLNKDIKNVTSASDPDPTTRRPSARNQKNITYDDQEKLTQTNKIIVRLSHVYIDKNLFVVDPVTKSLYPFKYFPRPITVTRSKGSRQPTITAYYSPDELPKRGDDPTPSDNTRTTDNI